MSAQPIEPKSGCGSAGSSRKNDLRDVVFLHGWGQDASVWGDFLARLAPRFRVHAPDLPGYGAAADRSPYTLETIAEAMAHGAPRRCHVVGWSLGGQVALAWARRAPHQVERLALIATTPCFAQRPGWSCALAAEEVRDFARALAADRPGTLARFAALQAHGDARARQVIAALRRRLLARGAPAQRVLEEGLRVLLESDLRATLGAVAQPALVLHGACDRIVPPAAGRRLARMLPAARFRLLLGCAHAPFLSRPARVARALAEFLDE